MLEELRRCNSIGDIKGVLFLVRILAGKTSIPVQEVSSRCCLERGIKLKVSGAVAFLEYLGMVVLSRPNILPTENLRKYISMTDEEVVTSLSKECIDKLVEDGIFDRPGMTIDSSSGCICMKRSTIPLAYAAVRNFLICAGAFYEVNGETVLVAEGFEQEISNKLRSRKKNITLEQLLKEQQEQSQRGLEGEEFVLSLEHSRLPSKIKRIKRISDFDVAAGYDIVSFESEENEQYNRFIEVKTYLGSKRFFWSENEIDTAKIKGDNYILCLVDYKKIKTPGYVPEFIKNPYNTIFNDSSWLINAATYRIEKISD